MAEEKNEKGAKEEKEDNTPLSNVNTQNIPPSSEKKKIQEVGTKVTSIVSEDKIAFPSELSIPKAQVEKKKKNQMEPTSTNLVKEKNRDSKGPVEKKVGLLNPLTHPFEIYPNETDLTKGRKKIRDPYHQNQVPELCIAVWTKSTPETKKVSALWPLHTKLLGDMWSFTTLNNGILYEMHVEWFM